MAFNGFTTITFYPIVMLTVFWHFFHFIIWFIGFIYVLINCLVSVLMNLYAIWFINWGFVVVLGKLSAWRAFLAQWHNSTLEGAREAEQHSANVNHTARCTALRHFPSFNSWLIEETFVDDQLRVLCNKKLSTPRTFSHWNYQMSLNI